MRPTEARVDLTALRANTDTLRRLAPDAHMGAVVKADGYGHGADAVAVTALAAGASWLAVATLEEAVALRAGPAPEGIPILLLSELDPDELAAAIVERDFRLTIASQSGAAALTSAAGARADPVEPVRVHLKIDTGMHRLGVQPEEAVAVADRLAADPDVRLEGVWTHLAVADHPDDGFTTVQLGRFDDVLADLDEHGHRADLVHAANSAGVLEHPSAHRDLTRVGIALYGVDPDPVVGARVALEPVLSLVSRVRAVRTVDAGEGVSYGRHWRAAVPTRVATVPIGYADGVRRDSASAGVEVLIRGRRRKMLGVVTMDQVMVEVDADVAVGDEVVLIGSQGSERVTVNEIALRLDTIGYEILTSVGPRVPRRVID